MAGEFRPGDRVEVSAQVGSQVAGERGTVLEGREGMALVQFDHPDRFGGRVQLVPSYMLHPVETEEE